MGLPTLGKVPRRRLGRDTELLWGHGDTCRDTKHLRPCPSPCRAQLGQERLWHSLDLGLCQKISCRALWCPKSWGCSGRDCRGSSQSLQVLGASSCSGGAFHEQFCQERGDAAPTQAVLCCGCVFFISRRIFIRLCTFIWIFIGGWAGAFQNHRRTEGLLILCFWVVPESIRWE